jgi:ribose transport system substrate-binding protein
MSGRKLSWIVSILVLASIVLGACAQATPAPEEPVAPEAPVATEAPAEPVVAGPVTYTVGADGMVDTTAFKKDPPYTLCFSNASVANDWRVAMVGHVDYAIEEARGKGLIKDYFYADANNDPNKQISDIEDLLTKGCDVMLISAAAQDVVDPGAKQAMEAGVPVITVDRDVMNPDNRVSYTDGDSCLMGKGQAEWLAAELGGKGDIVLLSGIAGASPAEERLRCAREVFASIRHRNWRTPTPTDPTGGQKQMEAWITQFGDQITGIWSDSALQSVGVVNALLAAGMKVPPITGEDWALFLHQAVDNDFAFAGVTFPNRLGYFAVTDALDLLAGVPIPFHHQIAPITITKENLDTYYNTTMSDALWLDMLPEVRMILYGQ